MCALRGGTRSNGRTGHPIDWEPERERLHTCEWPGCEDEAEYPAPRARNALRDFRWFCLEHVRLYNRTWDFFSGMSRAEIEAYQRDDVTWHKPTWRMGTRPGDAFGDHRIHDGFGFFDDDEDGPKRPVHGPRGQADRMMAVLNVRRDIDLAGLKRRYKQLAKQNHPDLHGGCKQAEERLKRINEAYTYLVESGLFT